jgi:long-chain acyl-CoA synthetase
MDWTARCGTDPEVAGAHADPDCWVFDVDGCLVDSLTGTSLRPGARDVLEHLSGAGRRVLLWSAGGDDYARERAERFAVADHVSGYFGKDERDGEGYYRTEHLPTGPEDAVFVDDRPEDLARELDVLAVSPYLSDDPHDRGLAAVARRAGLTASSETLRALFSGVAPGPASTPSRVGRDDRRGESFATRTETEKRGEPCQAH